MNTTDTAKKSISMMDCTHAFAVPGADNIIDCIHPVTGLSFIYGQDLAQMRVRYPGAEIVSIEDHCSAKAARQDTPVEWIETTESQYREMLEVLPPAMMLDCGFLVGEPTDHHATTGRPRFQAFIARLGKFYASSRPITRTEFKEFCTPEVAAA